MNCHICFLLSLRFQFHHTHSLIACLPRYRRHLQTQKSRDDIEPTWQQTAVYKRRNAVLWSFLHIPEINISKRTEGGMVSVAKWHKWFFQHDMKGWSTCILGHGVSASHAWTQGIHIAIIRTYTALPNLAANASQIENAKQQKPTYIDDSTWYHKHPMSGPDVKTQKDRSSYPAAWISRFMLIL